MASNLIGMMASNLIGMARKHETVFFSFCSFLFETTGPISGSGGMVEKRVRETSRSVLQVLPAFGETLCWIDLHQNLTKNSAPPKWIQ